jgi:hypothetical protein
MMQDNIKHEIVCIPNGQSLSQPIALHGKRILGIVMPPAWTAAGVTFSTSMDGQHYNDVVDPLGNEIVVTAQANQHVIFNVLAESWDEGLRSAFLAGAKYLLLRSGTLATPVPQAQDSPLNLILEA